jgi:tRNA1Val (adenine37-N6)-methyltransferase
MSDVFHFKQFDVDQAGCGMKINTDGVLLGALASAVNPSAILDIGTGTGVIAMMLAQRYPGACIEALEIDPLAAETATRNFRSSGFHDRLQCVNSSFQLFSVHNPTKKYDLIVSNPPFFANSLKNPDYQKQLARHATNELFADLISFTSRHLSSEGVCYLILPLKASAFIQNSALEADLHILRILNIKSYPHKDPHRQLIALGFVASQKRIEALTIYQSEKQYSDDYRIALKDFLTIF